MTNAEYESCPIGIKNAADINHLAKTFDFRLDAMVERIEEKIDAMNDKIQLEFKQMNDKIDIGKDYNEPITNIENMRFVKLKKHYKNSPYL